MLKWELIHSTIFQVDSALISFTSEVAGEERSIKRTEACSSTGPFSSLYAIHLALSIGLPWQSKQSHQKMNWNIPRWIWRTKKKKNQMSLQRHMQIKKCCTSQPMHLTYVSCAWQKRVIQTVWLARSCEKFRTAEMRLHKRSNFANFSFVQY